MRRRLSATRSPGDQQPQAAGDVFLDRVLGQAHASGDLLLGQVMNTPQDQRSTGLRRQGGDSLGQSSQSVSVRCDAFRRRRILEQMAVIEILQRLERHDPRAPDMGGQKGTRGLKQVGLGMADVVHPISRRQETIGLLDDIVRFKPRHALTPQPGPQSRLVRQHFSQKPARPPLVKVVRHARTFRLKAHP